MAITLEQAKTLRHGQRLHYTGKRACTFAVGPRGGQTLTFTEVRVSGAPKTWKRTPGRVEVPVKYGLYESAHVHEGNLSDWHLPGDCPALAAQDAHNAKTAQDQPSRVVSDQERREADAFVGLLFDSAVAVRETAESLRTA